MPDLAFIVPLIIVFMLFLLGVTDKQFSAWLKACFPIAHDNALGKGE